MLCKGTGELTGKSCSVWDFAPKAPAQDKVSHRQLLTLTEVVLTREVALAARDNIKPQPQFCKASLAFSLEAPAGPFYFLPYSFALGVCKTLSTSLCPGGHGPSVLSSICLFFIFFRGIFKAGSATCTNIGYWPQECSPKYCVIMGWCNRKKRCPGISRDRVWWEENF